jgi:hypothetical protein
VFAKSLARSLSAFISLSISVVAIVLRSSFKAFSEFVTFVSASSNFFLAASAFLFNSSNFFCFSGDNGGGVGFSSINLFFCSAALSYSYFATFFSIFAVSKLSSRCFFNSASLSLINLFLYSAAAGPDSAFKVPLLTSFGFNPYSFNKSGLSLDFSISVEALAAASKLPFYYLH